MSWVVNSDYPISSDSEAVDWTHLNDLFVRLDTLRQSREDRMGLCILDVLAYPQSSDLMLDVETYSSIPLLSLPVLFIVSSAFLSTK